MRRIHSLDYIKTILAVIVVFAHTNWLQVNVTPALFVLGNGILRMLVPLFCIIAGYFLELSIRRGKSAKWLRRVMALYLFWMLAYLPIWQGQVTSPWTFATTMLWGFFHLWFLIGLFFAGLMLIALNWLGRRIAPDHAIWFIILPAALCAVLGVAMQYADLTGLAQISVQRYRNGIFFCFPFVAIGYLIRLQIETLGWKALPDRAQVVAMTVIGTLLLMAESWFVQSRLGTGVMIEVPLAVYLVVPALFLLALQVQLPPQPVDLGMISASIYFLHIWAFRLADLLEVRSLFGLMLFGVGLPVLVALIFGGAMSRRQSRKSLMMPSIPAAALMPAMPAAAVIAPAMVATIAASVAEP